MLLLLTDSDYNIRSELFSQSEQGLWLDPSDMNATKAGWRRNLLTYSEQFDNSAYTKLNCTITPNTVVAPNGTTTADTLTDDATAGIHYILHNSFTTETAGILACRSYYVKKGTARYISISPINTFNFGENQLIFDFDTGTYTNTGSVNPAYIDGYATPENVGNGWWRLSFWNDSGQAGYGRIALAIFNGPLFSDGSYSGSGSTVHIWGFQYERGVTSPTAYQLITDFSTEFKAAFPTHAIYQDSNGVTPCTAAGDPVGLILDQSRGGLSQIGAELLNNGGFDSSTNWQAEANWSIGSGVASASSSSGQWVFTSGYYPAITAGRLYRIEFEIKSISSGSFRAGIWSTSLSSSNVSPTRSTVGKHVVFVFAPSAGNFVVYFDGQSNATGAIDNVSVREVPGNHAYQTSSGQRPTLARIPSSGRRNLLTRTEEFDNAAWLKTLSSITQNSTTAPDGSSTADTITASAQYGNISQSSIQAGTSFTFSVYAKKSGFDKIEIGIAASASYINGFAAYFNLTTGAYVSQRTFGSGYTLSSYSIADAGSGWYRLTVSGTISVSATPVAWIGTTVDAVNGSAFFIWGAQLETGSSATNYQKVVATTDVSESGFSDLYHLVFDGSDDSLTTNAVDFAGWTQDARRNLLINTENFSAWSSTNGAVVTANSVTAPDGTQNAAKVTMSSGLAQTLRYPTNITWQAGQTGTVSVWLKKASVGGSSKVVIMTSDPNTWNTGTDTVITLTDTWTRYSLTGILSSTSLVRLDIGSLRKSSATESGCDGEFHVWGAQVEVGPLTDYQAPGTAQMTVIAGVRKLSDASYPVIVENSIASFSNNGTFGLIAATSGASTGYYFGIRGTSQFDQRTSTSFNSPHTAVIAYQGDISAVPSDQVKIKINGLTQTLTPAEGTTAGNGSFGNYPLFIGRRNQATLPFNGHLYQLIIRGKTTPTGKLLEAERFTARKTGVTGI